MKKTVVVFGVIIFLFSQAFAGQPINEKIRERFKASFPLVQNASWYEVEGGMEVYFEEATIKCHLRYDQFGNIVFTKRYYHAGELSPFLKAKLSQKYPGKKVFGVTEVTTDEELTYLIVLEDEKNWMQISVSPTGQMQLVNQFKKA